jgi:hydroxymethylpyrimidine/phosphomethylpyrimidine kinase
MTTRAPTPIALTIAGSDSSGGAGIQADLKTFSALGVYGASVVTALTAQNTRGVDAVMAVPPDFVAVQIRSVATDLAVTATKTGMLASRANVLAVAAAIAEHRLTPLVVDPVMVATSGASLLDDDAVEAIRARLIPLATLVTPNLAEAARLLGRPIATDTAAQRAQAEALLALGAEAVLVKGGHAEADEAIDMLATRNGVVAISLPRLATRHTHGTGCTLAAAITALLATGAPLADAVKRGKRYLWEALAAAEGLGIGAGAGPVDHLYHLKQRPMPV